MALKGIINNSIVDPNKILPMRYLWARQHYKDGVANNWTPEEISMQKDVEQWKSPTFLIRNRTTHDFVESWFFLHRRIINRKQFSAYRVSHVTNPECRQYFLRQAL